MFDLNDFTVGELIGLCVVLIAALAGIMLFSDYMDNKDLHRQKFICQNEQINGADVKHLSSFRDGKFGPMIYIFKMKDGRKIRTEGCSKIVGQ